MDRPHQNYGTSRNRVKSLLPKLKEIMSRPEFRIVFLCLAWFVLSRAKTEQQFFPSFLVFCVALLQFRLSGYAARTRIPSFIGNIGIMWYILGVAISLFSSLYNGLIIEIYPEDNPVVMGTAEYILLRQLIQYIFGADYFPLMYLWLGTLFVAFFDWSFILSPEEKYSTGEIKEHHARQKKKKLKK